MATARRQRRRRVTGALRCALPLLLLPWLSMAGTREPGPSDAAAPLGDATPRHGRRLEQVPATLPACKTQLATSQKLLGTCKTQLNTTAFAKKACTTKLAACTQSATAKQLSACQRRGASYNGQAASAGTKLQHCNSDRDTLAKENRKLRAAAAAAAAAAKKRPAVAAAAAKGTSPVATVAAEPDPLVACQQQVTALQSQLDALNASLAGAQAALQATQIELDSMNAALVQRDADVAALQEQLAAANEQLQLCGDEQDQLAATRWQLSQLQQVYTVTDGLLNQTRDDLDKVSAQVDGLREANASCHVELSNQGAKIEDAEAELAACQLGASACAGEKASLQEAWREASQKQFPPEEYVACANQLISLQIANETNASAAGECQSQLADVERSYQECMTRNRRLLKLPGGRPALSRTTV